MSTPLVPRSELQSLGKILCKWGALSLHSVQSLSHVQLFVTPWTAACQTSLSITNARRFLKLAFFELVMPSNHLILCHPLLLPSVFPSIRVFSSELLLHSRWPKFWSFSFSISPSNEYSGLMSSRIDWFDLLAVQGTLKSLLQHHSSKSIDSSVLCLLYGTFMRWFQTEPHFKKKLAWWDLLSEPSSVSY